MAPITALQTHLKFGPWPLVPSPPAASGVNLCGSLPRSPPNLLRRPFQPLRLASFYPYLTPLPATRAWAVRPRTLSEGRALDSAQTPPPFPSSGGCPHLFLRGGADLGRTEMQTHQSLEPSHRSVVAEQVNLNAENWSPVAAMRYLA